MVHKFHIPNRTGDNQWHELERSAISPLQVVQEQHQWMLFTFAPPTQSLVIHCLYLEPINYKPTKKPHKLLKHTNKSVVCFFSH